MRVKMRYVTARPSLSNPERWYWQRPGYPLTRLPDDEAARFTEQKRLNDVADGNAQNPVGYGTVAWAILEYLKSEKFSKLAHSTRVVYDRWCDDFTTIFGNPPMPPFTPTLQRFVSGTIMT